MGTVTNNFNVDGHIDDVWMCPAMKFIQTTAATEQIKNVLYSVSSYNFRWFKS